MNFLISNKGLNTLHSSDRALDEFLVSSAVSHQPDRALINQNNEINGAALQLLEIRAVYTDL